MAEKLNYMKLEKGRFLSQSKFNEFFRTVNKENVEGQRKWKTNKLLKKFPHPLLIRSEQMYNNNRLYKLNKYQLLLK